MPVSSKEQLKQVKIIELLFLPWLNLEKQCSILNFQKVKEDFCFIFKVVGVFFCNNLELLAW